MLSARDRLVLDRAREGGDAGLIGANRSVNGFLEGAVEQRNLVVDRFVVVDVKVEEDEGAPRRGAEAAGRPPIPRGERGDFGILAKLANQLWPLFVDRLWGALEVDDKGSRVAEV